jgi:hypothetical protein
MHAHSQGEAENSTFSSCLLSWRRTGTGIAGAKRVKFTGPQLKFTVSQLDDEEEFIRSERDDRV